MRILQERCAEPISMSELAERIVEREYENPSTEDLKKIRCTLYHAHIPRLEDADVVSYNRDDDTVAVRPNFDTLLSFIDQMSE